LIHSLATHFFGQCLTTCPKFEVHFTGADQLTGGSGADVLIGGLGADTLSGGGGADNFRFVNEISGSGADGSLGGTRGDTVTDFNWGTDRNGQANATQADRLDMRELFDEAFTGRAVDDAAKLADGYLDIRNVLRRVNGQDVTDWQIWVDRDGKDSRGASAYGLLATVQNVSPLGSGSETGITGTETTSELLRKMLEEGRLVVAGG
jgi:Ca2+-binding RTX toxin-like protein